MSLIVCKFGGTSLADAAQIRKAADIIRADPGRRFVVPSAPGRRNPQDQKITDLLYLCHDHARQQIGFDEVFKLIADRFGEIASALSLSIDLSGMLEEIKAGIIDAAAAGHGPDFAASRGEYLNGRIMAALLGCEFVDPTEMIFFDSRGRLDDARTYPAIAARLGRVDRAVVPGFYGAAAPPVESQPPGEAGVGDASPSVRTFSRGGSDISGAVVAAGVRADVYENWTDVSRLLMTDPRIVANPKPIDTVTYQELRELAYMGAHVLHDEAIFPVRYASIPVNIRNTNRPDDPGTMIVADAGPPAHAGTITGIAGRKDFTVIMLTKALMNTQIGFARRVLSVFEDHDVSVEHMPSGIDTFSVVVADTELADGKLEVILKELQIECEPDSLTTDPHLALIATVGRGMAHIPGMAARLFNALAQANVNIRMIDQGSSELNIIVGVSAEEFETAVQAIYAAFVKDGM